MSFRGEGCRGERGFLEAAVAVNHSTASAQGNDPSHRGDQHFLQLVGAPALGRAEQRSEHTCKTQPCTSGVLCESSVLSAAESQLFQHRHCLSSDGRDLSDTVLLCLFHQTWKMKSKGEA